MQSRNPLEVNILIVVIAQEGSSERASKKLGMARSLTRRGAWLERNIGVKLFGRSTRNVELTGGGKAFRSGVVALPQPRGTRLGPGPVSGADRQRALPRGVLSVHSQCVSADFKWAKPGVASSRR